MNYVNASISNNELEVLGAKIKLPLAMQAPDSKGTLYIPTDAVKKGDTIKAKISVVEKINDKYLLYLHINNDCIFIMTDEEYKVGSEIKISFDLKKLEFKNEEETIIKPFDAVNRIPLKFIKLKHQKEVETEKGLKKKNVIDFYLDILGLQILSPDKISRPILSALGTKSFSLSYRADVDAYSFKEDPNGFKATVLEEIIYDDERFLKVDVLGEQLIVRSDSTEKELMLNVDLDKIGITETSIDIKLV